MVTGGTAMFGISLGMHEHLAGRASFQAIGAMAYLCLFGSLVAFSAYSYLLKHTRPSVATSYAYVNPVIAVLLGVVFANERFGLTSVAGTGIVLVAVVVVLRARSFEPTPARRAHRGA